MYISANILKGLVVNKTNKGECNMEKRKTRYPINENEFREYFNYDFSCYDEYEYPYSTYIDERNEADQMNDFYENVTRFYLTN